MAGPFAAALGIGASLFSGISGFKGGRDAKNAPIGIGPMFSRLSGQYALDEARKQSRLQLEQSNIAFEEGVREEALRAAEIKSFKEGQAASFANTGLAISGSAKAVLEETNQLGMQELAAIRRQTEARSRVLEEDALRILRSGYSQQLNANIEAQMSEFEYANQQRKVAAQSRQAGVNALFSGASLIGMGAQSLKNKFFP
jgi:hypothetical protein